MATNPTPQAISAIDDPSKIRVSLYASGQQVHAPLTDVVEAAAGDRLLPTGGDEGDLLTKQADGTAAWDPLGPIDGDLIIPETIDIGTLAPEARTSELLSVMDRLRQTMMAIARTVGSLQGTTAQDSRRISIERQANDTSLKASFDETITLVADDVTVLADRTTTLEATIDTPGTGLSAVVEDQQTAIVTLTGDYNSLASDVLTVTAKVPSGNASGVLRIDSGAGGVGILSEIGLSANATYNGQTTTAALKLRARDPGNGTDPPIGEWVLDAIVGKFGYTNPTTGTFQEFLSVNATTGVVTIQNLSVPGSLLQAGGLQVGDSYSHSGFNVYGNVSGSKTSPYIQLPSTFDGNGQAWAVVFTKAIPLADKSATDANPYYVVLNVSLNGQISFPQTADNSTMSLLARIKLNGTQYGPTFNMSTAGGDSGHWVAHGVNGAALFVQTIPFPNTGGTGTLTLEIGASSSNGSGAAGAGTGSVGSSPDGVPTTVTGITGSITCIVK